MQYTPNYNFDLPEANDDLETASRTAFDDNFTALDTLLKDVEDDIDDVQDDISGLNAKTGDDIPFESGSADSISDKINILSNLLSSLNGAETRTLLWTNPNPSSTFNPQTISLDLSDYEEVEILYRGFTSDTRYEFVKAAKGLACSLHTITDASVNAQYIGSRKATVNNNGITFTDTHLAVAGESTPAGVYNSNIIPYKIYGIKTISI